MLTIKTAVSESIFTELIITSKMFTFVIGNRLQGMRVSVCPDTTSPCTLCGVVGPTGNGKWAIIVCDPAISGNFTKIEGASEGIAVCEIVVTAAGKFYT